MQQIIDLKAKLAEGESKKYSLLRIATRLRVALRAIAFTKAIAQWQHPKGNSTEFNFYIRTFERNNQLK